MMYNNKQLLHSAEMLWDNCLERRMNGKACKGCLFYNTYLYGRCCIGGPAAWPMTRIKKEYEHVVKKRKSQTGV